MIRAHVELQSGRGAKGGRRKIERRRALASLSPSLSTPPTVSGGQLTRRAPFSSRCLCVHRARDTPSFFLFVGGQGNDTDGARERNSEGKEGKAKFVRLVHQTWAYRGEEWREGPGRPSINCVVSAPILSERKRRRWRSRS